MVNSASDIPLEVIYQILDNVDQQSDLYQCSLVSKAFNAAANPSLWRHPVIHNYDEQRLTSVAAFLLKSLQLSKKHGLHTTPLGHNICKLEFDKSSWVPDILKLVPLTPMVEDLSFANQDLTQKTMKSIAKCCPKLRRLSLSGMNKFSSQLLTSVGQYCHQFRALEIKDSTRLSPAILMDLKDCGLERLDLFIVKGTSNEGMVAVIHQLTDLVELNITHCSFGPALIRSVDNAPILPRLTTLEMGGFVFISPDELTRFIRSHPLLTTLTLGECIVNAAILDAIADSNIRDLTLRENMELAPFTNLYPWVETLTVYGMVNDTVLSTLPTCFPNLKSLAFDTHDFPDLDEEDVFEWIPTCSVLVQLVKDCPRLTRLDFDRVLKSRSIHWQIHPVKTISSKELGHIRHIE